MDIGVLIKDERLKRKLTIKELASQLDISSSYLSRLENNKRFKPNPDIMRRLENKFDKVLLEEVYIPKNIEGIKVIIGNKELDENEKKNIQKIINKIIN